MIEDNSTDPNLLRLGQLYRGAIIFVETSQNQSTTTGADAVDVAIAQGIDFDGTPIPAAKLDLYHRVMSLEAQRQRSGVSNTMRSRIVRIGAKHIPLEELNQMLSDAGFSPLKDSEIAFYYKK
jgi:hypothetical protein